MRKFPRFALLLFLPMLLATLALLSACANTDSNGAVISRTRGGGPEDTPAITSPAAATNGSGIGASVGGNGLGGGRGSF